MELIGLDKDKNPLQAQDKSLVFAQNIDIDTDNSVYVNAFGYQSEAQVYNGTTCGVIKIPNGFVLFTITSATVNTIYYVEVTPDGRYLLRKQIQGAFNFSVDRPITGDYSYNGKNELIVAFTEGTSDEANETRVINLNDPKYDGDTTTVTVTMTADDLKYLNLIPDLEYPYISLTGEAGGSMLTGTYQVAFAYKLKDGTYSNYSILCPSLNVDGSYLADNAIGVNSGDRVIVTLENIDTSYSQFKLAITYSNEDSTIAYETTDLDVPTSGNMNYTITDVKGFYIISQEDILINTIGYIKDAAVVNFQDRLYRANVRTVNYSDIDEQLRTLTNNIRVLIGGGIRDIFSEAKLNSPNRHFQTNEVYVFYAGYIDYKGELINIYRIPYKSTDTSSVFTQDDGTQLHLVRGAQANIQSILEVRMQIPTTITIPSVVKKVVYFYIRHEESNSRVLSVCPWATDIQTNDFSSGQTYSGQFLSSRLRCYPFEYLYNRVNSINVGFYSGSGTANELNLETVGQDDYGLASDADWTGKNNGTGFQRVYGLAIADSSATAALSPSPSDTGNLITMNYYAANNSASSNTAGESYFLAVGGGVSPQTHCGTAMLLNQNRDLYTNFENQYLVVAGSYEPCVAGAISHTLIGDCFSSYYNIRITQPANTFLLGGNDVSRGTNLHVLRWIWTGVVESKLAIRSRYSYNTIDKVYKGQINTTQAIDWFRRDYTVDNPINDNNGRAYSPAYNNIGIEEQIYYKSISDSGRYITRIVRSLPLGSESTTLNWRKYLANEYRDITANRGEIIELRTDQINMYIQQRYGLRLLFIKDELNSDDTGGSYLGSSDLFDRDPREVRYSENGYIGCTSKFDIYNGLAGYFVVDSDKGVIYNVSGLESSKISAVNMNKFFVDNIIKGYNLQNNPYSNTTFRRWFEYNEYNDTISLYQNNYGLSGAYAADRYRWGYKFHVFTGKWISRIPDYFTYSFNTRDHNIALFNNSHINAGNTTKLHLLDRTTRCQFPEFGNRSEQYENISTIKLVLNKDTQLNKLLENIVWIDRVYSYIDNVQPNIVYYNETVNNIMVHNDDQCTGYHNVFFDKVWWQGKAGSYKANLWAFNDVKDLLKANPFLKDDITLLPDVLKTNPKWYNAGDFRSPYVLVTLQYCNNVAGRVWELQEIDATWQQDNRR